MSGSLTDATHWRARASEARILAQQISDPVARADMLKIAAEYERIAQRAAARAFDEG